MVIVCLYEGHILDYSQSSSRDVASRAVSTRACLQNTNLHCTAKPGAGTFPVLSSRGLEPFLYCQAGSWSLSCTAKLGAGAFPALSSRGLEPFLYCQAGGWSLSCTVKSGAGALLVLPSRGLEPFLYCQAGGWSLSCIVKPGAGALLVLPSRGLEPFLYCQTGGLSLSWKIRVTISFGTQQITFCLESTRKPVFLSDSASRTAKCSVTELITKKETETSFS